MLGSDGRNALHRRHNATILAVLAHFEILLFHIAVLRFQDETGNLEVAESAAFDFKQQLVGQFLKRIVFHQLMLQIDDVAQLFEEPNVDFRKFLDALDAVALFQSLRNGENAQVGGIFQCVVEVVEMGVVVAHETVQTLPNHSQSLLNHLLERAAYRHNFADRLHTRTDEARNACEFCQVPTRNLANHIVERGRNVGRRGRSHFADLVERVAQRNLRGDESERIARGLRCQRTRTRQSGVDFDDAIVVGHGVEGELDVALAHDVEMAHAFDGNVLQHFHLLFRQRTRRRNHNRLARVDAERIEILHRSDRETAVVGVADALKFNLFPTLQRLFDENLRRKRKSTLRQFDEGFLVAANAASKSAERVGRANHNRETDFTGSLQRVVHIFNGTAHRHFQVDFSQFFDEKVAVFRVHDRLDARAEHFHAVVFQNAFLIEFRAAVQRRLTAESEQNAVWPLLFDDFRHEIGRDGLEIHLVGDAFRSLNRGDVRIHQH